MKSQHTALEQRTYVGQCACSWWVHIWYIPVHPIKLAHPWKILVHSGVYDTPGWHALAYNIYSPNFALSSVTRNNIAWSFFFRLWCNKRIWGQSVSIHCFESWRCLVMVVQNCDLYLSVYSTQWCGVTLTWVVCWFTHCLCFGKTNCTNQCLVLLHVRNQTEDVIRMIEQVENLYPEINFLGAHNDIKISIYNKSYVHRSHAFIDSIWIRADDACIVGEIYTTQGLKVSDSLLRKDFFP